MEHKIFAVLVVALVIFFYTTGSKIVEKNETDIKTFDGMVSAGKLYVRWLGHVFLNTKDLAGKAVEMDWAGNSTGKS